MDIERKKLELEIKNRMFRQTQELVWYNIHKVGVSFGISKTITVRYGNEEDALKVIEEYKNKHQVEKDNEVKSTTYKMIDLWKKFIYLYGGYGITPKLFGWNLNQSLKDDKRKTD